MNERRNTVRLLVCCTEYYPHGSGIANVAYNVVQQLRQRDICCEVCSPIGPDICLGSSSLIQRTGRGGLLHYWDSVRRYFRRSARTYDVAWLHYPLFLGGNPFPRCVVTIHSTAEGIRYPRRLAPYKRLSQMLETFCLNRLTTRAMLTAVSHQSLDQVQRLTKGNREIALIRNGVDTNRFLP
jgi:glycosyltransferase involved in cell wall biosynthesis